MQCRCGSACDIKLLLNGLLYSEISLFQNEIDREILEKPPDCESGDSGSYTTASSSSDEADGEEVSAVPSIRRLNSYGTYVTSLPLI